MKKRFTFLGAALMLLAFLTIPLGMRGQTTQTVTISMSEQGWENAEAIGSGTLKDANGTNTSFNYSSDKGEANNDPTYYTNGTNVRFYCLKNGTGNGGSMTITPASGITITKVVLTATTNYTPDTKYNVDGGSDVLLTWNGTTGTVSNIAATNSFKFRNANAANNTTQLRITQIEITYTSGTGPAVATPTFTPAGGTYTGAQTVTINCATEDVDIYYTLDGTEPDDESTHYNGPFTISQTTTVKAIAFDANDNTSAIATATYTILAPMTIAQVRAQGTGSVLTTGTVTSFSVNNSNLTTAYIQDATAAIVVFGDFTVALGDEISVSGSLSDYNGLLEIINPNIDVISSGNTVNPELMTIAEVVESTNQAWYIRIENAKVTEIDGLNTTIAQGDNTIVVRGISGVDYVVNDVLSLNGNIGCYNNANQIANPQNIEVQPGPSITFNPATINIDAGQNVLQIPFTYQNIPVTNYQSFTVHYYDAAGEEIQLAQGDTWYYLGVTGTNDEGYKATGVAIANEGEARSAYFKVSALDADNNVVYSNLVTIKQAEAPTYATLPFEFDGGRADIDTINGLYQEGLDSDYSSSPKLKLNTTGDYVLLQFLEVPGKLTFDIKGNGFKGGTFKLQTSANGVVYDDLKTYNDTILSGSTLHESFDDLNEDIRYIKWIYTEKASGEGLGGNVALGNIKLLQPYIPQDYDLTIEPFENLEIFTFVGGDETGSALEGAGTIQVTEGDEVMLSVSAEEGFVMQSLMVDGVEHVNDITEDLTYTFNMPNHNVTISATAVADVPFEPVTYTLANTIESGKTYIIVGKKTIEEEDHYFAMGEQRTNNRKGVEISVDGTTATVESQEVHEFVITAIEGMNGFYSIYDNGYLFAASEGSNYLRTNDTLDVDGQWEIDFDTVCSIVASNSSKRNVMKFNYNSNNPPIFSCYLSTTTNNTSPVYLYVKDETTITQTIELVGGQWNWFSTYIETDTDPNALLEMLETSMGDNVNAIESVHGMNFFDEDEWLNEFDFLTNEDLFLIEAINDCTIELQGEPVDPASHTITIYPQQWNLIGFPCTEVVNLVDALAGFEAVEGDAVEGLEGYTDYDGEEWFDAFDMTPGHGYLYWSASDDDRYLTIQTGSAKTRNASEGKKAFNQKVTKKLGKESVKQVKCYDLTIQTSLAKTHSASEGKKVFNQIVTKKLGKESVKHVKCHDLK